MQRLEAAKLAKSTDYEQAWALSERIVQHINKPDSKAISGQVSGQDNGQVLEGVEALTDIQAEIILKCTEPIGRQGLKRRLNLGSRYNLRIKHSSPLLERGVLWMSFPD